MRVMHVIDGVGLGGGAEESLVGMLPLLQGRGITGIVVCLYDRDGHEEALRRQGFRVEVLGVTSLLDKARQIRRLILETQPDLVHASLIDACFATRLAMLGLNTPQLNSLVNTTYDPVRIADLGIAPWKMKTLQVLDSFTSRWVGGGFHALTGAVKQEATDILHIPAQRVWTVPRGRDSAQLGGRTPERRARVRESLGVAPNGLMVLNVGRQDPQKGKTLLVKAFGLAAAEVPQARLFIAGREGKDTPALRAAVEASPVRDRIKVLGHRSDIADLLAAADLFVFPSFYEGLGGALVEAMAMSCPIIGADAPAVAEVLGHGAHGRVVRRGDVRGLADAMRELLESPEARDALARSGRARFEEVYELSAVIDSMADLYRTLVTAPPDRTLPKRLIGRVDRVRATLTNRLVLMESAPGNNAEQGRLPDDGLTVEAITSLSDYEQLMTRSGGTPNRFASQRFGKGATFLALVSGSRIVSWLWVSATGGAFLFLEIGRTCRLARDERVVFDVETPQADRGKGYAERLIRAAQHMFVEDHLLCYVVSSNASSLRVFEKCRFRRAGEVRWYSANPLALVRRTRHG